MTATAALAYLPDPKTTCIRAISAAFSCETLPSTDAAKKAVIRRTSLVGFVMQVDSFGEGHLFQRHRRGWSHRFMSGHFFMIRG
jgi:hypothetical protein